MKFSKEGVSIKYKGFTLVYRWPILQTYFFQRRFRVQELDYDSDSILDCLTEITKPNKPMKSNGSYQQAKKVSGFDCDDLAYMYANIFFEESCGVVMTNIEVLGKPFEFWQKVPLEFKPQFLKDAVYLKCNNSKEVERVVASLPETFCNARGYVNGECICDNFSY